ncbi:MAG TPA: exosortase system-associated protein, TIGR04073 family [Methylococcaceae bacterium]|nr:exosortase system-associated protein, TIGR04073 family [Methylococcaceae bacterium]
MSKATRGFLFPIVLMCLASSAWGYNDYGRDMGVKPLGKSQSEAASGDYGTEVGMKFGSALSNLALGWLEIPKTVLATTNQVNLGLGLSGGVVKGILHGIGRTLTGAVDMLTFPLPTQPIAEPQFVWQNFDEETHYNRAFQLKH